MSSPEANKAQVRRYFDAIGRGDFDAVEAMMAPELRFWCAGGTGAAESVVFRSPSQLRTDLDHSLGDLYDREVGIQPDVLSMTAEADRVVAEVRIRGRSARTGEDYDNLYAFFFWLDGELFREIHEHLDTAYVSRVLLEPAGIGSGAEMPWLADDAAEGEA